MDNAPDNPGFTAEKAAILGVGLIGGSIGKALIAGAACSKVMGLFRRKTTMKTALTHNLVESGTMSVEDAVSGADVVILAANVDTIPGLAEAALPYLNDGALITDVGSVKGVIVEKISQLLEDRPDVLFAGSHPLYGSHLRGPAAGAELDPAGSLTVVTPAEDRDNADAAAARAEALWHSIGMKTIRLDPGEHDRLIAFSSHLPHAAAAALARVLPSDADALAATGFLDTTRIASGSPQLWAEIMCANSAGVVSALDALALDMEAFREAVKRRDSDTVARLLEAAATARTRLSEHSSRKEQ